MKVTLEPRSGRLGAEVFENSAAGIRPRVQFWIRIPVQPFMFDGEAQDTEVVLEAIELDVQDWRSLENREFTFPVNPSPGYIDGSVYLDHVHNPVDVTSLRFGRLAGDRVSVTLGFTIDFTFEGRAQLGVVEKTWDLALDLDIETLDSAFQVAHARGILPPP